MKNDLRLRLFKRRLEPFEISDVAEVRRDLVIQSNQIEQAGERVRRRQRDALAGGAHLPQPCCEPSALKAGVAGHKYLSANPKVGGNGGSRLQTK